MGELIGGRWHRTGIDTVLSEGTLRRPPSIFRDWVKADKDAPFRAEAGRYHIYDAFRSPARSAAPSNAVAKAGKVGQIGVSNFNRALMADAARLSRSLITNQFEYYPYLNQSLLIEATRKARLAVTGYCGMAGGRLLADPLLAAIVVRQGGVVALSRATDPGRIVENVAIFDCERDDEDTAAIHALVMPATQSSLPPRRVTAS